MSSGRRECSAWSSFAAASKHVRVLEDAGLLQRRVDGRRHLCRLRPKALVAASKWLAYYERFWADRLDRLESRFASPKEQPR